MLRRITYTAILLASAVLAVSFGWAGIWPLALAAVAAGILWAYAFRRHWEGAASLLLVCFVILAALAVNLAGGRLLAPVAVVASLAAWDLHRFLARLRSGFAEDVEDEDADIEDAETVVETAPEDLLLEQERRELERQHLRRLLVVSGIGLALAWIAEAARFRLALPVALALGLLAILGLSQVVRSLVRQSD
jgi:hypothetical protein